MRNSKVHTAFQEINPSTMAVIANRDKEGLPISYILEENEEYISKKSPSKIIDAACMFFGSSLKGRIEGSRIVSGLKHKVPISIDPISGMYFFPTYSPMSPKCSWINHSHVSSARELADGKTELMFKNGKKIILDVSCGSLTNQVLRTAQYRYRLDERLRSLKREFAAERISPPPSFFEGDDPPHQE